MSGKTLLIILGGLALAGVTFSAQVIYDTHQRNVARALAEQNAATKAKREQIVKDCIAKAEQPLQAGFLRQCLNRQGLTSLD